MNINGTVYPLLEKTGHLTPAVKNKIKHQPVSKWTKVLDHDPDGISSLFHAIFLVPGWEKNRDLRDLKEKIIKAQPKNKYIAPTHGIANPGYSDYIISMLQLFRTSHIFDSILQENGAIRVNNFQGQEFRLEGAHDDAKNTLIKLRQALRAAVNQIRNKVPLEKGTLEKIKSLFEKIMELYPRVHVYNALDFLEERLGNVEPLQIVTKNTFSDGKKHTITQEKQERPTNLEFYAGLPHDSPPQANSQALPDNSSSGAHFQAYFQQLHLVAGVNFVALERDKKTHAVVRVLSDQELNDLVTKALRAQWQRTHKDGNWIGCCGPRAWMDEESMKRYLGEKEIQEYMKVQSHYFEFLHLVKKECTLQALPRHVELNITSHEHPISIDLDLSHNIPQALRAKPHNPKYTLQSANYLDLYMSGKSIFFLRDLASGLWTRYENDKVTRGLKWEQVEADLRHNACRLLYIPTPQVAPKKIVVPSKSSPIVQKPKVVVQKATSAKITAMAPKPNSKIAQIAAKLKLKAPNEKPVAPKTTKTSPSKPAVVKPKAVTPKPSAKKTPDHKPNSKKH
jgi:hypothetical protein